MAGLSMSTQIVMDHTGDRRHQFDPQNARELKLTPKSVLKVDGTGIYGNDFDEGDDG